MDIMRTNSRRTDMAEIKLLRLQIWLSPAFPTGGFAYSQGTEWAVKTGDVRCGASLADWLSIHFHHGSGLGEAIVLRAAYRAGTDAAQLTQLGELALAASLPRERAEETLAQGAAFLRAAGPWRPGWLGEALPYPVAVGALAAAHQIGEDATCLAFLTAQASTLISAAVRLVPLGQSAGIEALAELEPVLIRAAARARSISPEDIGGCGFRAEIASMCHEIQETRLFRS